MELKQKRNIRKYVEKLQNQKRKEKSEEDGIEKLANKREILIIILAGGISASIGQLIDFLFNLLFGNSLHWLKAIINVAIFAISVSAIWRIIIKRDKDNRRIKKETETRKEIEDTTFVETEETVKVEMNRWLKGIENREIEVPEFEETILEPHEEGKENGNG